MGRRQQSLVLGPKSSLRGQADCRQKVDIDIPQTSSCKGVIRYEAHDFVMRGHYDPRQCSQQLQYLGPVPKTTQSDFADNKWVH